MISMLLVLLPSCQKGSYTIREGKLEETAGTYAGEYKSFDGYIEYALGQQGEVDLSYEIDTISGKLQIYVVNKDKEVLLESGEVMIGRLSAKLEEETKVYLRIQGENHEGSFFVLDMNAD